MTLIAIPGSPLSPVVDGRLALALAGHDGS
jgi:hypothetical protein